MSRKPDPRLDVSKLEVEFTPLPAEKRERSDRALAAVVAEVLADMEEEQNEHEERRGDGAVARGRA